MPYWWLVELPMWFFGHCFWKVEGTVRIHVSHVQLPYMVINVHGNMQGEEDQTEHRKTQKF